MVLNCLACPLSGSSSGVLQKCRPTAFDAKVEAQPKAADVDVLQQHDDSSDDDDMPPLYQNNNRQVIQRTHQTDSSEDE